MIGHFDTVWPIGQIETMPVRREDGRLYGPGSYDMKAGIAMTLLAARILIETDRLPARRIAMIWTSDEEVGSDTSRAILEAEARRSRAVFVLEPALAGGGVKTARKGVADFRIEATGISAHAGVEPDKGASAIHELAWQAVQLLALNDPPRGLTVNVGCIVGGTRPNVVAAEASMDVDVRIPTEADAVRVTTAITTLVPRDPRVRLRVSGGVNRPPMERTAGVAALYERAARISRQLGRELPEGATGGGSDGNFTAALGIPTLDGLGPDGAGAHALHEHVLIDSVPFRRGPSRRIAAAGLVAPAPHPIPRSSDAARPRPVSPRNWNGASTARVRRAGHLATVTRVTTRASDISRHVAQRNAHVDSILLY